MLWWLGTIIGALSLVLLNSLKQGMDLWPLSTGLKNFLILLPILCLVQLGFWYGFRHAPSFVRCWFFGSACSALLGILSGVVFFDKTLTLTTALGVALVLSGAALLVR